MSLRSLVKDLARPSGVIVFSVAGPGLGSVIALTFAYANADALRDSGLGLALLMMVFGGVAVGLAVLPTHALSLISGWAFGFWGGLAIAFLGALLGTPTGYFAGKRLSGPAIAELAARHRRSSAIFETLRTAPLGKASFLVALLRMSPVIPYAATNVLAAVMRVPLRAMLLGTLLGHAPRAGVVVAVGAGMQSLEEEQAPNYWFLGIGIAAAVLAIILMGVVAKRALERAAAIAPDKSLAD